MNNKISKTRLSAMNYYYRNFSLDYFLDSVSQDGLTNIELWTSPQHFWIEKDGHQDVKELKRKVAAHHLQIICLTPQQSNPNPYNLAAKDERLRKGSFGYFKNLIDSAVELNVHLVALNSGWDFYDENPAEAWDRSVAMLKKVADYAKDREVKIAIEALQPDESHLVNSIVDLKHYLKDVNKDNVGVNLDLGAMARNYETIAQYFESLGEKIIHCHFVDGNPVGHRCWGEGERNPGEDFNVFNYYGYQGYFTFEFGQSKYFLNPAETERKALRFLNPFLK
ncbi:sugar phosphate isomerase/epimerase family protein [Lactobacillus sp. ESL0677]|uniref:sugar phosphate isomerase/epimerase family protein n=1 Tax=Lactobacillus sp. ESL0677 TaxID=2983208 RepID=UPI0023F77F3B|nr:sugar phosphate isomerase/epimerase family protein [Lactobacillus sp. ESL0677]WEV37409.1 sugar phosphate isomerase/epimerase [Lactobacillus sp. ESL0677]